MWSVGRSQWILEFNVRLCSCHCSCAEVNCVSVNTAVCLLSTWASDSVFRPFSGRSRIENKYWTWWRTAHASVRVPALLWQVFNRVKFIIKKGLILLNAVKADGAYISNIASKTTEQKLDAWKREWDLTPLKDTLNCEYMLLLVITSEVKFPYFFVSQWSEHLVHWRPKHVVIDCVVCAAIKSLHRWWNLFPWNYGECP
jgi:hypothetical protein